MNLHFLNPLHIENFKSFNFPSDKKKEKKNNNDGDDLVFDKLDSDFMEKFSKLYP